MSRTLSPSTGRRYGVRMVAVEWEVGRSTVYVELRRECHLEVARKRGPKTAHTDEELTALIRADLDGSPFVGEGHRKVWAGLRVAGVRTSLRRVLRLMREAALLARSPRCGSWDRATTRGQSPPNGRTRCGGRMPPRRGR
jgi:hypothetical protein